MGGIRVPAKKSPVKRHNDNRKGRQVDCLLGKRAYELKIRVTIAASGQGRWREELDFPIDCKESGYKPVLVVLDSTSNPKLSELKRAFLGQNGEVYLGAAAWEHLDKLAGPAMSLFLETYVRGPIERLIENAPETLPTFIAKMSDNNISIAVGSETFHIVRHESETNEDQHDEPPDDVEDNIPG